MKKLLTAGLALCLAACSPAQTASVALLMQRDGLDLVIPNAGETLLAHWGLVVDVTPDYRTDAQGQAWCPDLKMLNDAQGHPFLRLTCDMPALEGQSQRRLRTLGGLVLHAQGGAYRAGSGTRIVPLVLP